MSDTDGHVWTGRVSQIFTIFILSVDALKPQISFYCLEFCWEVDRITTFGIFFFFFHCLTFKINPSSFQASHHSLFFQFGRQALSQHLCPPKGRRGRSGDRKVTCGCPHLSVDPTPGTQCFIWQHVYTIFTQNLIITMQFWNTIILNDWDGMEILERLIRRSVSVYYIDYMWRF